MIFVVYLFTKDQRKTEVRRGVLWRRTWLFNSSNKLKDMINIVYFDRWEVKYE